MEKPFMVMEGRLFSSSIPISSWVLTSPQAFWSWRSGMPTAPVTWAGGWTRLTAFDRSRAWQSWQGTTARIQSTIRVRILLGTERLALSSSLNSHSSSVPLLVKGQLKYLQYFFGHQPKELLFLCLFKFITFTSFEHYLDLIVL
jgi:hypothetical protein